MRVPRALVILGCAVVLAVGGAVAYAQIPSANGTFTACINKTSGAVRIIDAEKTPPAQCASNELRRTWNQQGVPGTDGADGVSGIETVIETYDQNVPFLRSFAFTVDCPEGKAAIAGGGVAQVVIDGSGAGTADLRSSGPISVVDGVAGGWGISLGWNDEAFFPETARLQGNISVVCVTAN